MNENKISYLSRTFEDYKKSLKEYIGQYYPQIASDLNDASIGSWIIDMVAAIGDNLSYYIDKTYNETNLESAQQKNSIFSIARSNGFKVPGPKGSVALCEFSLELPAYVDGAIRDSSAPGMPDWTYAPIIKKGTKVSSGGQVFEVMNDIDFNDEFDFNGFANRRVVPIEGTGKYLITKSEIVTAGESRIYKQVINDYNDIHPFMEVLIPDNQVMNVESILFKIGANYQSDPSMSEFMVQKEYIDNTDTNGERVYRFFEVNSLIDSYRWGDSVTGTSSPVTYKYASYDENINMLPVYSITKGEWKPVTQKFITEFTDNGYLKIIFGSGEQVEVGQAQSALAEADDFTKYQISKVVRNNFLGKLPPMNSTMYVLYRVGGGQASNVPANSITKIDSVNIVFCNAGNGSETKISNVRKSLKVNNPYPSVTGKDAPTVDEIRQMIKYNSASQERCVTVKDYENRVALLPPRYGCPFRVTAVEENNKVMLYALGINSDGTLSNALPEQLIRNILNYLSVYRSVNDYVEMKSGKVINIGVDADVDIDKAYNAYDVMAEVIATIKDFFDINKHHLGETIYVSKLSKAITNVSGVLNLMDLRIINKTGPGYSSEQSIDPIVEGSEYASGNDYLIDLIATGYRLNSDADAMFEIKNPDTDIRVRTMIR